MIIQLIRYNIFFKINLIDLMICRTVQCSLSVQSCILLHHWTIFAKTWNCSFTCNFHFGGDGDGGGDDDVGRFSRPEGSHYTTQPSHVMYAHRDPEKDCPNMYTWVVCTPLYSTVQHCTGSPGSILQYPRIPQHPGWLGLVAGPGIDQRVSNVKRQQEHCITHWTLGLN